MKYYLLSSLLLASTSILLAQSQTEPFKKANTILIETNLAGIDAYTLWGKHLGQNGFSIDKSDPTFNTLTTATKDTKKFNVEYYLICAVTDSGVIKIKIKWRIPPSPLVNSKGTDFFNWEYSASKATTTNSVYIDIITIINSFGGYTIKYLKD